MANDTKETAAVAVGIVDRLNRFTPIRKAEILALAQALVGLELQREARAAAAPPPLRVVTDE